MNNGRLLKRIVELMEAMKERPPADGAGASRGAYVSHAGPAAGSVEDLLDHLRLRVKYLLFDLEATRRENHYLRNMLQRRPDSGEGADPI